MRFSMGGWESKRPACSLSFLFLSGLAMKRCAVARLALLSGCGSRAMSLSARASPSGLRVSSTALASARYSRRREMANCTAYAAIGARNGEHDRDDEVDEAGGALGVAAATPPPHAPQNVQRRKKSATRAIMPTRMPTSVAKRMS